MFASCITSKRFATNDDALTLTIFLPLFSEKGAQEKKRIVTFYILTFFFVSNR
jgi:hypothetical protein